MAFQFDLETDFDGPFSDGDNYYVDFALGYDLDTSEIVTMSVMLILGDSYLEDTLEENVYDLQFAIRVRSAHDDSVSEPDFTIDTSKKYIPAEARGEVVTVLHEAIDDLITGINPEYITMETFYPNLPEKALAKYHAITTVIEGCGYKVADAFRDGTNGINYWFYSRE